MGAKPENDAKGICFPEVRECAQKRHFLIAGTEGEAGRMRAGGGRQDSPPRLISLYQGKLQGQIFLPSPLTRTLRA